MTMHKLRPAFHATLLRAWILIALLACSDERGAESHDAWSLPEVELVPELRISGDDAQLLRIGTLADRGDGLLAVSQPQVDEVLVFRDSTLVGRVGGSGEGPGEFRSVSALGWHSDTLWVLDHELSRATWFLLEPEPRVHRTVPLPHTTLLDGGRSASVYPVGLTSEGYVLSLLSMRESPDVSIWAEVRLDGPTAEERLRYTDPPSRVRIELQDRDGSVGVTSIANPWQLQTRVATRDASEHMVVVRTDLDADGRSAEVTVESLGPGQAWRRSLEIETYPIGQQATDSALEAQASRISRGARGISQDDLIRRYRLEATVPLGVPPIKDMVVGGDGTVVVSFGPLPGYCTGTHLLLDSRGNGIGSFNLGAGRIRDAGAAFVWAVETDDFGVPSIVRYRWE